MFSNTKLLVLTSFFVIITGFGFLWFGIQSTPEEPRISGESFRLPSSGPSGVSLVEVQQATPSATLASHPFDFAQGHGSSSGNVFGIEGERAVVLKVVDGDTITLTNGKTVRFIGIDTPETVDPRRPVGCFGKEASNKVKSLLSDKPVILQKDVSDVDKYKRLLRYIYLPLEDGQVLFVNDYLVREGFAKVLTYPPDVKYNEQFREAEKQARESSKGLWARCI